MTNSHFILVGHIFMYKTWPSLLSYSHIAEPQLSPSLHYCHTPQDQNTSIPYLGIQ